MKNASGIYLSYGRVEGKSGKFVIFSRKSERNPVKMSNTPKKTRTKPSEITVLRVPPSKHPRLPKKEAAKIIRGESFLFVM